MKKAKLKPSTYIAIIITLLLFFVGLGIIGSVRTPRGSILPTGSFIVPIAEGSVLFVLFTISMLVLTLWYWK